MTSENVLDPQRLDPRYPANSGEDPTHLAVDRPPARPHGTHTMPTQPYDPWRDADGTPIPPQCRVVQIAVGKQHGALPSRLHHHGQVLGRGINRLIVRFDDNTTINIRPHLVRVLTTSDGR